MMPGVDTDQRSTVWNTWPRETNTCFHTSTHLERLGVADLPICRFAFLKDAVGLRPKNGGAAAFKSTTESFTVADVTRLWTSSLNFNYSTIRLGLWIILGDALT